MMKTPGLGIAALLSLLVTATAADGVADRIDWPDFMAGNDPVWKRLPTKWEQSPFLGNGWMGTMIYRADADRPRSLRIDVHHAGVQDHREGIDATFATARLPIGYFELETVGHMTGCDWRLDLWDAELRGTVTTTEGSFELRAMVPADRQLIVMEIVPNEGERDAQFSFHPDKAESPRRKRKEPPMPYPDNPPHEILVRGDVGVCRQPLLAGGEHATAWQVVEDRGTRTLLVSVAHSRPETDAVDRAVAAIARGIPGGYEALVTPHRAWWHAFYPTSFVSVPDPFWQSFYWIQMYKMGSATRSDGCLIDNHGPWLQDTAWPYATWNLNVQLTYWPYYASGHLAEAESLPRHLSDCRDQLRKNVVPAKYQHDSFVIGRAATETLASKPYNVPGEDGIPEVGNLPWALHNVWLHYRHTMDDDLLRNTLFPLLKGTVNYYLHFLEEDDESVLHLPRTYSPEYGVAPDCNYDLALLRWGCSTLLWINERLALGDERASRWRDVLDRLTEYPGDQGKGYYIGRDLPYTRSHRHYSHLLMIYPLYLVNADQPGSRTIIDTCLADWCSMPGALTGYSYTGAASMYAALGEGDSALEHLNLLRGRLQPNTMYREAGPVIETPLSGAQSIHDMLVQSWGDCIRVFPAVPSIWRDVTVQDLRTEGAFSVSSVRRDGQTRWVRVKSLAGEPFRVRTGLAGPVAVETDGDVEHLEVDLYALRLRAGQDALFRRADERGPLVVAPVLTVKEAKFGLPLRAVD